MLVAIDEEKEQLATELEELAGLVRSGEVTGLAYCVLTEEQYWLSLGATNRVDFAFLASYLSVLQRDAADVLIDKEA